MVADWRDFSTNPDSNSSAQPIGAPEGSFKGLWVNNIMRNMMAAIRLLGNETLKLPANPTSSGFPEGAESRAGTMALQQAASVQITGGLIINTAGMVPIRGHIPFSGTLLQAADQEQYGYAICDGRTRNGITTPDLRQKFVRGAASGQGAGGTGGSTNMTRTSSTWPTSLPDYGGMANASGSGGTGFASGGIVHRHSQDEHTHTTDVTPPYYDVIWLMRVA